MTFEVDCRFDRCPCIVEEAPDGTLSCRHMKERELDGCEPMTKKNNWYCRERKQRGQRGLDGD